MVQVLKANPKPRGFAESILGGISQGIQPAIERFQNQRQLHEQMQKQNETIKQLTGMDVSGLDPKQREIVLGEMLKQQGKDKRLGQTQDFLGKIFGGQGSQGQMQQPGEQGEMPQGFNPANLSDADIAQAGAVDPNLGRLLQQQKDLASREMRHLEEAEQKKFEAQRAYETGYSKEAEKKYNQIRDAVPKKEMALDFARNAIETRDVSYFSPDKLADATGIDLFRTSKGAQLVTAGKENLLSNMSRVGAKAQNIWFEQRLNSMFAKIGQSQEANLTVQEMLEGENEIDRAKLAAFDEFAQKDEEKYGFVKKDIERRVSDAIKPLEKEILKRTTYRMKEIEEQEKGLSKLKKEVGKNVSKGTPMTLAMAKLYKDKYGKTALDVAEKNGYYIPSLEEFKIFQSRPQEHREMIAP